MASLCNPKDLYPTFIYEGGTPILVFKRADGSATYRVGRVNPAGDITFEGGIPAEAGLPLNGVYLQHQNA